MRPEYKLHAVVFQDEDWWIAQILEHNLATAARGLEAIPAELERFLTTQIVGSLEAGIEPFEDLPRAPQRFWDLYEQAAGRHEKRSLRLPDTLQATASFDALVAA